MYIVCVGHVTSCDVSRSLPHSLHPVGETELCLITKGDKKETKELLEAKEIEGISKVCLGYILQRIQAFSCHNVSLFAHMILDSVFV